VLANDTKLLLVTKVSVTVLLVIKLVYYQLPLQNRENFMKIN